MITNGLFRITEHRGYATIRCAPAYNDVFLGTRAYYDPDEKAWIVSTRRLDELIAYLQDHDHEVIADRLHAPDHRVCPHGRRWGHHLDDDDHASIGGCVQCEWRMPDNGRLAAPHEPGAIPFTWAWWAGFQAARAALHPRSQP